MRWWSISKNLMQDIIYFAQRADLAAVKFLIQEEYVHVTDWRQIMVSAIEADAADILEYVLESQNNHPLQNYSEDEFELFFTAKTTLDLRSNPKSAARYSDALEMALDFGHNGCALLLLPHVDIADLKRHIDKIMRIHDVNLAQILLDKGLEAEKLMILAAKLDNLEVFVALQSLSDNATQNMRRYLCLAMAADAVNIVRYIYEKHHITTVPHGDQLIKDMSTNTCCSVFAYFLSCHDHAIIPVLPLCHMAIRFNHAQLLQAVHARYPETIRECLAVSEIDFFDRAKVLGLLLAWKYYDSQALHRIMRRCMSRGQYDVALVCLQHGATTNYPIKDIDIENDGAHELVLRLYTPQQILENIEVAMQPMWFQRAVWLRTPCGLQKLAARCYVQHYRTMPKPDIIPDRVRLRLMVAQRQNRKPLLLLKN